jgi:hypothetical protein
MAKLTGFGNLNWVLGDVNGNWKFAINTDGAFTGFTAGQTLAAITTPATATETEKKSVTFQLTDRVQIDVSYAVVLSAKLFPISNVTGINATLLSFADANGAVPPAVADTTLKVKALLAADKHTGIEGLSVSDFKYTVDGVSETPSGVVDNGNGDYTLTVVALAASTIVLSLWDSAVSKNVVIVSSELYRSNSLTDVIS